MTDDASPRSWLMAGDPAIRYQVLRDLDGASPRQIEVERARIAVEGWGASLLAAQEADGYWGGETGADRWRYALFSLHLLVQLGIDPAGEPVVRAIERTRDGVTWGAEFGDSPFFEGEEEPCINGRVLAIGAYFGQGSEALRDRLVGEQLEDGGWNCDAPQSTRGSFHSTICVLEGLLAYARRYGETSASADARRRGEEYLLSRRMFHSLSTGAVIDERWTRFSFPDGSDYDVLRGLDYLRASGRAPEARVEEAVELVISRRLADGRWPYVDPDLSHQHVVMERATEPGSRWITLRALRVLRWAQPLA
jgi:hypothetical protein